MSQIPGCCAACGDDFQRVNKKRLYCAVCQSIRDIKYRPDRTVNCWLCSKKFWPIKSNYTMCVDCMNGLEDESYAACAGCDRKLRPAPGLEGYCLSCVQSSKSMRDAYLLAIVKRVDKLRDTRDVKKMVSDRLAEIETWQNREMEPLI